MNVIPKKANGVVYTPSFIVETMLDMIGYSNGIRGKHIIDNSCGDGSFLVEIVKRYCLDFLKYSSDISLLSSDLSTFIHGIDNDPEAIDVCINRVNEVVQNFGILGVGWDITCEDSLSTSRFDGKMDFVVGNPPYVRVHNLGDSYDKVKKYYFAEKGMIDLYIVFFEIGFKMLNGDGKLAYITPSSFLRSKAGTNLRKYITRKRNLFKVVDLGHYQPFSATTYTLISVFENKSHNEVSYHSFDEKNLRPIFIQDIPYDKFLIEGKFYFSNLDQLKKMREIEDKFKILKKKLVVKNGFATLADDVFIGDFKFSEGTIDVIKASTGKWQKCIFPYKEDGTPLNESELSQYKEAYTHLLLHRKRLEKRDSDAIFWYLFGRSQAIKDVWKDKIAINTIIRRINDIKLTKVPAGKGVYSGLYIIIEKDVSENQVYEAILSDDFIDYIKTLKNYKSGGYYSFSAVELEKFLNYKFGGMNG